MAKKTVIHVNQHIIKRNMKTGGRASPLTCKNYKENRKASRVEILDSSGNPAAVVVYSPDAPLKCGATCWVETLNEVRTEGEE